MRVTRTRRAVPAFMATVDGNAPLRRGWHLMRRSLTRYDAQGSLLGDRAASAKSAPVEMCGHRKELPS
ncbi:hypothetical protein AB0F71_35960 [Kitasatospora sp. NPDC028055]|uniref:hypothetical protein n=1 Tax=Kitasatospora sp. NPDC028055 TaxID=3155653 RepID=UPI0033CCCC26